MRTGLPLWIGLVCACFAQDKPDLGLLLKFDNNPSPVFLKSMEKELTSILSPAVFTLHWTIGAQSPAYTRSVVIRFHGSCSGREAVAEEGNGRVSLASTETAGTTILPYSDIDCDELRVFLSAAEEPQMTGREALLGRATGRVLAHEIYHILLQTKEHSKTGIAKAVHTPSALLSQSLRFEDGELEKIRSRFSEHQPKGELERPFTQARGSAGALSEAR